MRLTKLGHPADCNSEKETVQAKKERDNEIKKEVLQTLNKKEMTAYSKINCRYPNHHWYIRAKTQTRYKRTIN